MPKVTVRGTTVELPGLPHPDRVHGAEFARKLGRLVNEMKGCLLMRQGHIAARIAIGGKPTDEFSKPFGSYMHALIAALQTEFGKPEPMHERGARMCDWVPDDAGALHASCVEAGRHFQGEQGGERNETGSISDGVGFT